MDFIELISQIRETLGILQLQDTSLELIQLQNEYSLTSNKKLLGILPPIYPEWLGDKNFLQTHRVRFPYIVGEMANGIATAEMVIAAANAGMLGFFGAAGLMPHMVESQIDVIQNALKNTVLPWGSNLIHSPQEPHFEESLVDLYLRKNVNRVSASAYMSLNPQIVRYAGTGLHVNSEGNITRKNYVFAKISRPEVAKLFMSPAPQAILSQLVSEKKLSIEEANLAQYIPVAEDITIEADSGGHTDNRPLTALFPTIHRLAEQLTEQFQYVKPLRLGVGGGLGTPAAIACAFSLGAAYVLTGSINQSAVESGLSNIAKSMLLQADIADVIMAPAADMFELGVKLQVLKRGTLFAMRAAKLYELYSNYPSLETLPIQEKTVLEKQILGASVETIWQLTEKFFEERDPKQIERAKTDPKHRMALVFRWYLGSSSRWAISGDVNRQMDYQIWCGPAMGAFNKWVAGSFLADIQARTVAQIGRNLLEGAAVITRAQQLRNFGFSIPNMAFDYRPKFLT